MIVKDIENSILYLKNGGGLNFIDISFVLLQKIDERITRCSRQDQE